MGEPWRSNVSARASAADGGAFSSARDLDRFLVAYEDGTLLGRQLRDVMLTPRCAIAAGIAMGSGVYLDGKRAVPAASATAVAIRATRC